MCGRWVSGRIDFCSLQLDSRTGVIIKIIFSIYQFIINWKNLFQKIQAPIDTFVVTFLKGF